jgi:hypothetical protein
MRVKTSAKSKSLIPVYVVTEPAELEPWCPRCLMTPGPAADVEAVEELRFSGAAAGRAPWLRLATLVVAAIALSLALAPFGSLAIATVAVATIAAFWLIVPKSRSVPPFPRWAVLPMVAAFVAMLFVPVLLGSFDRDLLAVGYAVGFVLWLQLGLWIAGAFEPADSTAAPPGSTPTTAQRVGAVAVVVAGSVLFSVLAYAIADQQDGAADGSATAAAPRR